MEPWLADRLPPATVRVRPCTSLAAARLDDDGSVSVDLDDGDRVVVDEVLLATGYLPHVDDLQLHRTGSLPAAGHFGPFFGFTIGTRMSAAVITRAVLDRLAGTPAVPSPRPEPSDTRSVADC